MNKNSVLEQLRRWDIGSVFRKGSKGKDRFWREAVFKGFYG